MDNAEQILVIMLSSFLAIFLITGILVLIKLWQILKNIKYITEKAEQIADRAELVSEFFSNTAKPAAYVTLLGNIVNTFKGKQSKEDKNNE